MMSEQAQFRNAVKWSYVMNWGEQGANVVITFLLAYLLGPEEFGIVAVGMVYVLFIQMIMEQGLTAALIQRKNLKQEHLDSVFWLVLFVSLVLLLLSIGLSNVWASMNHMPQLSMIINALSLTIPIEGLTVVQKAVLQRNMDFKSLSIRSNLSVLAGGAVSLLMALTGFGVWALVLKQLLTNGVALALLWRFSNWRPTLRFTLKPLRELFAFSASTLLGRTGNFVNTQSDALLIGLFFGPVAVGLYRLADRLVTMVHQVATTSLQAASFPHFSRLQDKPIDLRKAVLSCIRLSSIVTIPVFAGIAVTSNILMETLGSNWSLSADALKILCIVGVIRTFAYFVAPFLQAVSKPHYLAILEWTHCIAGAGALVVTSMVLRHASAKAQVDGIAAARLAVGFLFLAPVTMYLLKRFCQISLFALLGSILPSVLSAASGVAVVFLSIASGLFRGVNSVVTLGLCALLGGSTIVTVLLWLDIALRRNILVFISSLRKVEPPRFYVP
jgi:PST family polysaccharide transporter